MTVNAYILCGVGIGLLGMLFLPGAMGFRLRMVRLKSAELVLLAAMAAIGIIGYGDKFSPTNDPPNRIATPFTCSLPPELASSSNLLYITDFAAAPDDGVVAFGLRWATNLFEHTESRGFYLFSSTNLSAGIWTPLGLYAMPEETNEFAFAVTPNDVEPDAADAFTDSLLGAGFYSFGIDFDSDGDGIADVLETYWTLTDPELADTDDDGLSDLEELLTHMTDPLVADTDGDGVPDGAEASAGSNPLAVNSDRDSLTDAQEIVLGTDPSLTDTDGDGLSDSDEMLVHHTDPLVPDTDSDGLPDGDETSIGTNPLSADTDGDGMPDGWEYGHGLDPTAIDTTLDFDYDGIANLDEWRLGTDPSAPDTDNDGLSDRDELGWQEPVYGIPLFDTSGGTNLLLAGHSYDDERITVALPFRLMLAGYVHTNATIGINGIVGLLSDRSEDLFSTGYSNTSLTNTVVSGQHTAVAVYWDDLCARPVWGSQVTVADVATNGLRYAVVEYSDIRLRAYRDDPSEHGTFQIVLPQSETNTVYVRYGAMTAHFDGSSATVGAQLPAAQLTFQTSFNSAGSVCSGMAVAYHFGTGSDPRVADTDGDGLLDGQELALGTSARFTDTDNDGLPDGWEAANGLDPLSGSGIDGANGDPDLDGLTNAQELAAGANPQSADSDGDTIPDSAEVLDGTDPAHADTDGDGLPDNVENAVGTDPLQPDSDEDGMNDGWEYTYRNVGFDPLVNNAADSDPNNDYNADPDGDGLSNVSECALNTNPWKLDTDGDGVADGAEVQHGSNPDDATDGGLADSRVPVSFYFGDESGSSSEKYRLDVTPVSGEGAAPAPVSWVNAYYGQAEARTAMLKPGWKYEVRMRWVSCSHPHDGYYYPNYDYTLAYWTSGTGPDGVIADDPEGLFQTDYYGTQYYGASHFPVLDKVAYIYVLAPPGLVPDYDRNGAIDDDDKAKSGHGNVFRFWINDDEDSRSTDGKYSEEPRTDRPGARSGIFEFDRRDPDWAVANVNGHCDLNDFAPILMDVQSLQILPERIKGVLRFRLRHGEEAVSVVWTGLSKSDAGDFLRTDVDECGRHLDEDSFEASTEMVKSTGIEVPMALASRMKASGSGEGVVFVEGRKATESPLVLDVLHGDHVVASASLPMKISPVEEMYWFYSLRGAEEKPDFQLPAQYTPKSLPQGLADRTVFFTHGFNVSAKDARSWGAEVFKRLWQSGSNAKFVMVTWKGNYNWLGDWANGVHYHEDVYSALKSAWSYKALVEREQPVATNRVLMAQSLGNMMSCEAILQGLEAGKYFMLDAAVASEAVDASYQDADVATRAKYVPPDWIDYTNMCWAANWYKWFADDATDSRGKMGWPGRFETALAGNVGSVYNYYSSGDFVFKEDATPPGLLAGVLHWPELGWDWLQVKPLLDLEITAEANCWQKQETHKGIEPIAGSMMGGWGFHYWSEHIGGPDSSAYQMVRYSVADAIAMAADGSITNHPVFEIAGTQLNNRSATQDGIYRALAEHVPAISSPVGGKSVFNSPSRDVNMNVDGEQGIPRPNGWGRIGNVYGQAWLHSDMKDMAFFYVYPLYNELITKGGLR